MKKILVGCLIGFTCIGHAGADEYFDLATYRKELKDQIEAIDAEIAKCEKGIKGWKAATAIGAIGTAAAGAGIAVQAIAHKKGETVLDAQRELANQREQELEKTKAEKEKKEK